MGTTAGSGASRAEDLVDRYAPIFDGDRELTELWVAAKAFDDGAARRELASLYVPLVRYVVSRLHVSLPPSLERADLVGFGTLGLITAIDRFDLDLGLTFQTYAVTRIRGAILDELRSLDWVPRTLRTRMHAVERAAEAYEQEHGAVPGVEDLAAATGLGERDVRAAMAGYRRGYVTSLDEQAADDAGGPSRGDALVDETVELPDEVVDHEESRRAIRRRIGELPLRDRAVVALYYFEELTFGEIGRVLGVSESRACQIHGRAIRALRADD